MVFVYYYTVIMFEAFWFFNCLRFFKLRDYNSLSPLWYNIINVHPSILYFISLFTIGKTLCIQTKICVSTIIKLAASYKYACVYQRLCLRNIIYAACRDRLKNVIWRVVLVGNLFPKRFIATLYLFISNVQRRDKNSLKQLCTWFGFLKCTITALDGIDNLI